MSNFHDKNQILIPQHATHHQTKPDMKETRITTRRLLGCKSLLIKISPPHIFRFLILLTGMAISLESLSQEVVVPAGGDASGPGGSVSFSVGQVIFNTHQSTGGSEWQGVQQPYEISVISGVENLEGIHLQVTAFPNPVSHILTLKIDNIPLQEISYQLFDNQGRAIRQSAVTDRETKIPVEQLAPGTYLLRVFQDNQAICVFKIIKR